MFTTRSRSLAAIAAGALLLAPLAGCGTSAAKKPAAASSVTSTSTPTNDPTAKVGETVTNPDGVQGTVIDPADFIKNVVDNMRSKKTAHMVINIGSSMTADADVQYGAKTAMKMTMTTGGQTMKAVLLGSTIYIQSPPSKKYIKIDKSTPGSAAILSSFSDLSPAASVNALRGAIKKVIKVGPATIGGEQLTRYELTVDTKAITKQLGQAVAGADLPKEVTYTMYLDSSNLLRKVDMDVSGQKVTMTVTDWGKPFDVTAPPASQVVKQ